MSSEPFRRIVPIFIPAASCPGKCLFCDQKVITGVRELPGPEEVFGLIREGLTKNTRFSQEVEIAFFGGSFTSAPKAAIEGWLSACRTAAPGCGIRISTRPDSIDSEMASWLKSMGVVTVELGFQSLDDRVLAASGRGHDAAACRIAARVVSGAGLILGIQLMLGLPEQSPGSFADTVTETVAMKPAFVRLYPVLVIRGTPLDDMYRSGAFMPWNLDETVSALASALSRFRRSGIEVARVGLHGDAQWVHEAVAAGPVHANLREMAEASLYLEAFKSFVFGEFSPEHLCENASGQDEFAGVSAGNDAATPASSQEGRSLGVRVSPRCVSRAIGPSRSNAAAMSLLGWNLRVSSDPGLSCGAFVLEAGERVFEGSVWT